MFTTRNVQKHWLQTLSSLILVHDPFNCSRSAFTYSNNLLSRDAPLKFSSSNAIPSSFPAKDVSFSSIKLLNWFDGTRAFSTGKGRSMRSKVERRMRQESGKTLREIRRAKKLRKKLMTDEERLIYNLRRVR